MGVSGLFKQLGAGERVSVAKLAAAHLAATGRPLRLAVDISIWLFQMLASKGGANPALRTFYYRLLRLLSLNIHPLFVFDGPHKPLFKRNRRVGGPGVRVASVPEFLAKELLRKCGFPFHIAPGEAEAECALLQRHGVVDAVLSEDVDTLMFGSGVLWRSWSAEGKGKVPTHCSVYRSEEVREQSRLDSEGMILVALMSGGDYIVEGIPGCGPKVACDAARAGFGKQLCELARARDVAGLKSWRERLQHEIKTNDSKFFTRKSGKLLIPDDFPNREVLGYYTDPCVSTLDKVARLKTDLKWDQDVDFPALRTFAGDAFDWHCLGGAKKFIRNLAPAMLVRNLRMMGNTNEQLDIDAQAAREQEHVLAIHGKRNHATTDGELEYRITFIPQNLVPIDLSIEDEDDDFVPAGGADEDMEAEDEWAQIPSSTQDESDAPSSPTKKRAFKPYHPDQPEKVWMLRDFLKIGCPLLVEDYEDTSKDPKEFFKQRRKAQAAAKGKDAQPKKTRRKKNEPEPNQMTMGDFGKITKSSQVSVQEVRPSREDEPLKTMTTGANVRRKKPQPTRKESGKESGKGSGASLLTNLPPMSTQENVNDLLAYTCDTDDEETPRAAKVIPPAKANRDFFKQFGEPKLPASQRTPQRRKRRSDEVATPTTGQRLIRSWLTPSPRKAAAPPEVISLLSSSPVKSAAAPRPSSPTPERLQGGFLRRRSNELMESAPVKLLDSVTKRRKAPLKRAKTAPTLGDDSVDASYLEATNRPTTPDPPLLGETVEAMDLASPIPVRLSAPRYTLPPQQDRPRKVSKPATATSSRASTSAASTTHRRSPRQAANAIKPPAQAQLVTKITKTKFVARESLPGAWKEVEAEVLDLTGDGSGWAQSRGRATMVSNESARVATKGWRKSGVEVLDLTGA